MRLALIHKARLKPLLPLRTEISNWRWAGVPFYIRTGKRLAGRDAHIVVNFRPATCHLPTRTSERQTGW